MRLWHQLLIPHLPRQQLLGQHRECCALRGAGWGRPHTTVNYVFKYSPAYLIAYHMLVMDEMKRMGYNPNSIWYDPNYRGTTLGYQEDWIDEYEVKTYWGWSDVDPTIMIYELEHNKKYLQECLENLKMKGIEINI